MFGDQFGGRSVTTIYKREQDKLANQFNAGEDLVAGMPVSLNAKGEVVPCTAANKTAYIGINMYNIKKGEITTVMVLVSHVMVYTVAAEELAPADLVTIEQVAADNTASDRSIDYHPHLTASKANGVTHGICLDSADKDQEEVRVLVFDKAV